MLLNNPGTDRALFRTQALDLFASIKNYPALAHWASQRIWDAVGSNPPEVDDPISGHLGFLLGCTPYPVMIEQNFDEMNILIYDANYFAIPRRKEPLITSVLLREITRDITKRKVWPFLKLAFARMPETYLPLKTELAFPFLSNRQLRV